MGRSHAARLPFWAFLVWDQCLPVLNFGQAIQILPLGSGIRMSVLLHTQESRWPKCFRCRLEKPMWDQGQTEHSVPGCFRAPAVLEGTSHLPCLGNTNSFLALTCKPSLALHAHAPPLTLPPPGPCLAIPVSACLTFIELTFLCPTLPTTSGPALSHHSICFPLTALTLPTCTLACPQLPTFGLQCLACMEGKTDVGKASKARVG